jgi:hypothetical protein
MVQSLEELRNLTRVTANADPSSIVSGENIVQNLLASLQLMLSRLTLDTRPKRVVLSKPLLELDLGRKTADVGLVGAVVARADANALAQEFLYYRNKRLVLGKLDTLEGFVGSLYTARERRSVVAIEKRHTLVLEAGLEVSIRFVRLLEAGGREEGIFPG